MRTEDEDDSEVTPMRWLGWAALLLLVACLVAVAAWLICSEISRSSLVKGAAVLFKFLFVILEGWVITPDARGHSTPTLSNQNPYRTLLSLIL